MIYNQGYETNYYYLIPYSWVIDDIGYKIVHNPGYDFDLGYKNKSEFFHYPGFKFVTCTGCAQEELFD